MEEEPMLKADGLDAAIIGVGRRCGQPDIIVYSYSKCVDIFKERDGMTEEDAEEWMEYNVVGAWVGETTPMFVHEIPDFHDPNKWLETEYCW
jgi:hypothetical protein|tara:strand:- start:187 stop:462 length:276 start_codon:yes stop_codon:yes gene_type:complete